MSGQPNGYTYGTAAVAASPVSAQDLAELHASVLWTDADATALGRAGAILVPKTEAILDVWYGFVGANAHLVATFAGSDGTADSNYLAGVRGRFGKWIEDLCTRPHDEDWLAYQDLIGARHTPVAKNVADSVSSTSPFVPLRHLVALIVPITVTIRDFLAADGASADEVDEMYHAWLKAVTLSVALWTRTYNPELW